MFIEKPWATNLDHAHELAELCRQNKATVMVGFSFRYHPAIVKLRSLLDNELGNGLMLNGDYVFGWMPPAENWLWDPANGNGFFNENSCHLFDAVNYLLGDPVSLSAEAISTDGAPLRTSGSDHNPLCQRRDRCFNSGLFGNGRFPRIPAH